MDENLVATMPTRSWQPVHRIGVAAAVAIAGVLVLIMPAVGRNDRESSAAESRVARCFVSAEHFTIQNFADTVDPNTAQWQRERENAFLSCLDDCDSFERQLTVGDTGRRTSMRRTTMVHCLNSPVGDCCSAWM